MPGTSAKYDQIATKLTAILYDIIEAHCMNSHLSNRELIHFLQETPFYPDISILCSTNLTDASESIVLAADVIDESTREFDLPLRLAAYQSSPTLRDYLLLQADRIELVHYRRTAQGTLELLQIYTNLSDSVPLTLDGSFLFVPLDNLYQDAECETNPES